MRNSKDRWSFNNLPTRPDLKVEDVLYWRNMLSKILKVGIEFEYNLPEKQNGTCKGDSNTCPCVNLSPENKCWQKCINTEGCMQISSSMDLCTNQTATCEPEDCGACEHFSPACTGVFCSNFVSYCFVCPDFQKNCEACKYRFDPSKNPDSIRKNLTSELKPNNTYGMVSPSGVHSITTDGSLKGKKGAEIITVGRRIDYWEFYKMANNIIALASERGAYLDERCSIHMHVLASYYSKTTPSSSNDDQSVPNRVREMERDMPEIILANLHQLVRRYQNAMTWMMMGLDEPHRMTRWEKFRVSVLPISAVMNHMMDVQEQVARNAGGNKYGWINYNQIEFGKGGDISRFHVEFRACDGLNSPSAVAAIACMYYALIIKAVEISRYGVVEIGDRDWFDQAQEVKMSILNNMKSYQEERFGDTTKINKFQNILISESLDLVRQLKAILIKIGPAYEVLEQLAERPCALRRVEGQTWEQIEKDIQVIMTEEGKFEIAVSEIIQLNQVSECQNINEWVEAVSLILRSDPQLAIDPDNAEVEDSIKNYVDKKREDGELVWSKPIGAPILI